MLRPPLPPEGICAGFLVWDDESTVLTVWMDDPTTSQKDGFAPGDLIASRVWDVSAGREYVGFQVSYNEVANTTGRFGSDAVYVVDWLVEIPLGASPREGEAVVAAFLATQPSGTAPAVATTVGLPTDLVLEAGYPNPFRTSARLRYGLPEAAAVRLDVFDARGRRVAVLADETQPPGWHEAVLPAEDLAAGVYVVRLRAGRTEVVQRVTLVR